VPRLLIVGVLLLIAQATSKQCDSSSSSSSSSINNSVAVAVNGGPTNNGFNQPFVSVTVCVPGSSNCQTIDGILLDTGSEGLRIVSSALRIPLPQQTNSAGSVVECLPFLDSVTWGPVVTADVRMAGEQANGIPIQVIGTDTFPSIPSACSSQGSLEETADDLVANGILGIGLGIHDCGTDCATVGASNPGLYYACPTNGACQITAQPVANQVVNPVAQFTSDNNGFVVRLPSVAAGGQPSVSGLLVFGIGTQSNNGLNNAQVFATDAFGNIQTTFNNQTYPAFLDSGSNGIFFLDSATTGLPRCKQSFGFYCPQSVVGFSATQVGSSRATAVVSFNAGNVDAVNTTFSAMSEATGENPGGFDWGLPFFFGRSVYVAIAGRSTPSGNGPYWAF
jgi:Protein of unknown function (DUF3443)